jgi:hypothetical protein
LQRPNTFSCPTTRSLDFQKCGSAPNPGVWNCFSARAPNRCRRRPTHRQNPFPLDRWPARQTPKPLLRRPSRRSAATTRQIEAAFRGSILQESGILSDRHENHLPSFASDCAFRLLSLRPALHRRRPRSSSFPLSSTSLFNLGTFLLKRVGVPPLFGAPLISFSLMWRSSAWSGSFGTPSVHQSHPVAPPRKIIRIRRHRLQVAAMRPCCVTI